MKFLIVIPVKNGQDLIASTLNSIEAAAKKSPESRVFIAVADGKSEDSTLKVIQKWSANCKLNNVELYWQSEEDLGLYDAISQNFMRIHSDIFSYLNAGDLYEDDAFLSLEKIFRNKSINWVTGKNQSFDSETQEKISFRAIIYRPELIRHGVYGFLPHMPVIQQESTFWRQDLWQYVNLEEFSKLQYAGDFYLWISFAQYDKLYSVDKPLAMFVKHGNHKSHEGNFYRQEMKKIRQRLPFKYYPLLVADWVSIKLKLRFILARDYKIEI